MIIVTRRGVTESEIDHIRERIVAGPCSVESKKVMAETANFVASSK